MSKDSFPPDHLRVDWTLVIENLPAWLEWIKETTGYSDNTLAICLGTDARQVGRWRNKGVVPSGGAMAALVRPSSGALGSSSFTLQRPFASSTEVRSRSPAGSVDAGSQQEILRTDGVIRDVVF